MPSTSQDTYQQRFGTWGLLRLSRTAGVYGFFPGDALYYDEIQNTPINYDPTQEGSLALLESSQASRAVARAGYA